MYVGVAAGVLGVLAVGLWLLFAQGEPTVRLSAAQALQQACDTFAESDYDKTAVEWGSDKTTSTFAISGNDSHAEFNLYGGVEEGSPLLQEYEIITKDGVAYIRQRNPDAEWTQWAIWRTEIAPERASPCFGADVSLAEDSSISDVSSKISEYCFVWRANPLLERTTGQITQDVLWVDSKGRPVRKQIIEVPHGAEAAAPGETTVVGCDSISGAKVELEETYSGLGETNIITAPILPLARVAATASGPREVTASWDGEDQAAGYALLAVQLDGYGFERVMGTADAGATSYTFTGLEAGQWQIRVIAEPQVGDELRWDLAWVSNIVTVTWD